MTSRFIKKKHSKFGKKINKIRISIKNKNGWKYKCLCVYLYLKRVWRYQRGNQNLYIEEEQTTQWPKEKVQKDKQRFTKHTYKTKDRVNRTPLKTGGELRCSGRSNFKKRFKISKRYSDAVNRKSNEDRKYNSQYKKGKKPPNNDLETFT